jgi:hypothetical protein
LVGKNGGKAKGCFVWRLVFEKDEKIERQKRKKLRKTCFNLFSTAALECFLVMGPFSFFCKCLTWKWEAIISLLR